MDMAGKDQAFKPAPGIADPEMLQPVDKGGHRRLGDRLQFETEQAAGAFEVAFPERMAGIAGQGGIEYPRHFRPRAEPVRQRQRRLLVTLQPDRQGAQAAQGQEAVVAAGGKAHIAVGLLQAARHGPDWR